MHRLDRLPVWDDTRDQPGYVAPITSEPLPSWDQACAELVKPDRGHLAAGRVRATAQQRDRSARAGSQTTNSATSAPQIGGDHE